MSYTYVLWPNDVQYMNTAMETSIQCSAGEQVYVMCTHGTGGQIRSVYSTFSGMLLSDMNLAGHTTMAREKVEGEWHNHYIITYTFRLCKINC